MKDANVFIFFINLIIMCFFFQKNSQIVWNFISC